MTLKAIKGIEKQGHNFTLNATFEQVQMEAYDASSNSQRTHRIYPFESIVEITRHFFWYE